MEAVWSWWWCSEARGTVAPTGEPDAGDSPPVAGDTLPPGDVGLCNMHGILYSCSRTYYIYTAL